MNQCKYCYNNINNNPHYCPYCGRNLSNILEKSDLYFGLSLILKIISIFLMLNYFLFHLFAKTLLSLSKDKLSADIYRIFNNNFNIYFRM